MADERLVLINQVCGHLFIDICNAFAQEGFQAELWTGSVHPGLQPLDSSVRVKFGPVYYRNLYLRRLLSWVGFTAWTKQQLQSVSSSTRVLAVSNPPFVPLLAANQGNPTALVIYDLYPDVLSVHGFIGKQNVVYRWWTRQNRKAFARAEIVFTLTKEMALALRPYFETETEWRKKVVVIPNWAQSHIAPVNSSENAFLRELNIRDGFLVIYAGNMGNTHPLESLVLAAERLTGDKIHFVFVGEGVKKNRLQKLVREKNLNHVRFFPYQPAEKFPHVLSAASLNVVALDSRAAAASFPSKTYDLLAAGRPILALAHPDSALGRFVRAHRVGEVMEPEDIEGITTLLRSLSGQSSVLQQWQENARKLTREYTSQNAIRYVREWQSRRVALKSAEVSS
ncbi:MAG: glycosyltransferase WbuB [Methanobacteriota archaeon]|nr:MAG: glycosyltransferase WbuB [Euryarchaeota archaeon]